ncbi:hypothetical protein B565_2550 [Aeromonas veronii B565]|nr:hypothetical protein B565_2550 [Aeromonas veronii B565]
MKMKSKQTLLNIALGCLLAVGISGCAVAKTHHGHKTHAQAHAQEGAVQYGDESPWAGNYKAVTDDGRTLAEIHVDTTGETYIDGNQVKPSHSGSDYLKFKQETITYTLRKSGASWKDSDAGTSGRILFD